MMTDYAALLHLLEDAQIEFIVVGGLAAVGHGSARFTKDVDVVYRRTEENVARLAAALSNHEPYLRGAPRGLPFIWDARTIQSGLNFTLVTDLGDIDLLGEIAGGGAYEALLPHAEKKELFGRLCQCLGLEKLIHVKRAAGRPKDFEAIAELQALLEERDNFSS
jgi:predicted nucleotidyltransferase